MIPRTDQSANIPIHTAIGPIPNPLARIIARSTLQNHIESTDTVIVNFTSPAARNPYAGMKENTHATGLTIVIQVTI